MVVFNEVKRPSVVLQRPGNHEVLRLPLNQVDVIVKSKKVLQEHNMDLLGGMWIEGSRGKKLIGHPAGAAVCAPCPTGVQ